MFDLRVTLHVNVVYKEVKCGVGVVCAPTHSAHNSKFDIVGNTSEDGRSVDI